MNIEINPVDWGWEWKILGDTDYTPEEIIRGDEGFFDEVANLKKEKEDG